MKRSIEAIVRDPQSLRRAVREADRAVAALAGTSTPVYLDGKIGDEGVPFTFRGLRAVQTPSDLAGGPITVYRKDTQDIAMKLFEKSVMTVGATVPQGYVVPVEWQDLIERLDLHGVKTERLPKDLEIEGDSFVFWSVRFPSQPFEGRFAPNYSTKRIPAKRRISAGSVYVPLNQRAARVAINLLEPEAPDSLIRWGFLNAIFERKEYFSDYIVEPIAKKMAELHPELKKEFDRKAASDPAFAKNSRARVGWWFERSPY